MNVIDDFDLSGVRIILVRKLIDDEKLEQKIGTFINRFPLVIAHDADVFTESGHVLLRFRKNVINPKLAEDAYNALQKVIDLRTDARTDSSGGPKINVKSNIIGYFDKHSISLLAKANREKTPKPDSKKPRLTGFNKNYPDDFKRTLPFLEAIDDCYKSLCPSEYEKQYATAEFCTPFRIANTSFTTVTVNKNYQTALHRDKGDFPKGFGNLTVFEKGKYTGGYTGFPQYGVGVDVRTGDFLAMDVHQPHCNTPIIPLSDDYERISFVCYLRNGIYEKLRKYGH